MSLVLCAFCRPSFVDNTTVLRDTNQQFSLSCNRLGCHYTYRYDSHRAMSVPWFNVVDQLDNSRVCWRRSLDGASPVLVGSGLVAASTTTASVDISVSTVATLLFNRDGVASLLIDVTVANSTTGLPLPAGQNTSFQVSCAVEVRCVHCR